MWKVDLNGNSIWLSQLGTSTVVPGGTAGNDFCRNIDIDRNGGVYCTGIAGANLGETFGGGGTDIFIMKLNSNGSL